MIELKDLLQLLATHQGKIVNTGSLSVEDINQARAANRMWVDEDCLGYVWIPNINKFPETEEELDFFHKWYPLDIERPTGFYEKMFERIMERIHNKH